MKRHNSVSKGTENMLAPESNEGTTLRSQENPNVSDEDETANSQDQQTRSTSNLRDGAVMATNRAQLLNPTYVYRKLVFHLYKSQLWERPKLAVWLGPCHR